MNLSEEITIAIVAQLRTIKKPVSMSAKIFGQQKREVFNVR